MPCSLLQGDSGSDIWNIWYQYLESSAKSKNGVDGGDVRNKINVCGRTRKATVLDNIGDMLKIPRRKKTYQMKLAAATGVSQSTGI